MFPFVFFLFLPYLWSYIVWYDCIATVRGPGASYHAQKAARRRQFLLWSDNGGLVTSYKKIVHTYERNIMVYFSRIIFGIVVYDFIVLYGFRELVQSMRRAGAAGGGYILILPVCVRCSGRRSLYSHEIRNTRYKINHMRETFSHTTFLYGSIRLSCVTEGGRRWGCGVRTWWTNSRCCGSVRGRLRNRYLTFTTGRKRTKSLLGWSSWHRYCAIKHKHLIV